MSEAPVTVCPICGHEPPAGLAWAYCTCICHVTYQRKAQQEQQGVDCD